MRTCSITMMVSILVVFVLLGCSSDNQNPVESSDFYSDLSVQLSDSSTEDPENSLWGIWELEFEIESLAAELIPVRDLSGHLNITPFISPGVQVLGYDSVNKIVHVNVTITNPYSFGGYDVRLIIFTDNIGHLLTNDDGWTDLFDIPAGININPFKAFAKQTVNRYFAGHAGHSEELYIKCPGGNFNVLFAIEASVPGNCAEPYSIENFKQGILKDIPGSTALLEIDVLDWQNDASAVMLDCSSITGGTFVNFTKTTGNHWEGEIVNNTNAPEGKYIGTILAYSGLKIAYRLVNINIIHVEPENGYAVTIGGTGEDRGNGIAVDSNGDIYITGSFESTVDFDPGPGEAIRVGWSTDAYLAKFNNFGQFLWVDTWGGSSVDKGLAVAVDDSGYVAVTGCFKGTADFDPDPGVEEIRTTNGNGDVFVSKFDSNGEFLWVRAWGGGSDDNGTGVIFDPTGNVFTVGDFIGTVDFDPSSGIDQHTPTYSSGTSLSKFTPTGDYIWAMAWDATKFTSIERKSSDLYLTGHYLVPMDFNPTSGVDNRSPIGWWDCFIIKLTVYAGYGWTATWGGAQFDVAYDVSLDSSNNIYVSGDFQETVDFDPGPGVVEHYSEGERDAFLLKLNSSGNYVWSRSWGGESYEYGITTSIDNNDSVYVAGFFNGTADFDPGPGLLEMTSRGRYDTYLSRFDSGGNFHWVRTFGRGGYTYGNKLANDADDNIFICGDFYGSADFNPGPNEEIFVSKGNYDTYYLKILSNGYWE